MELGGKDVQVLEDVDLGPTASKYRCRWIFIFRSKMYSKEREFW